jgi:FPC/CPF motif-containing protein YcgG
MLRREPLEYFPSMNPTSLVLHYKWKTGKEGTPLLDEHGNIVKDLDGNNITYVGTWKSPENLEQCRSAISTLHKARNMIGAYQKPCPDCIELDRMERYHGC